MERPCNLFYPHTNGLFSHQQQLNSASLQRFPELNQVNIQNQQISSLADQQNKQFLLNRLGSGQNISFSENSNCQYQNFLQMNNSFAQNMHQLNNSQNSQEQINIQNILSRQNLENSLKQQQQILANERFGNGSINLNNSILPSSQHQINLTQQQQQQLLLQQQQQQLLSQQQQQQQNLNFSLNAQRNSNINEQIQVLEQKINSNLFPQQQRFNQQSLLDSTREHITQSALLQQQQYSLNQKSLQYFNAQSSSLLSLQQELLKNPINSVGDYSKQNNNSSQNNLIQNLQQQINQSSPNHQQIQQQIYNNNLFINNNTNLSNSNFVPQTQQLQAPQQLLSDQTINFGNNKNLQLPLDSNNNLNNNLLQQQVQNMVQYYQNLNSNEGLSKVKLEALIGFNCTNASQTQNHSIQKTPYSEEDQIKKAFGLTVKQQYCDDLLIQTKKEDDVFASTTTKRMTESSLPSSTAISRENEITSDFDLKSKLAENQTASFQFLSCKIEDKQQQNESSLHKDFSNPSKLSQLEIKEDLNSLTIQEQSTHNFHKSSQIEEEVSLGEPSGEKQSSQLSKHSDCSNDTMQKSKSKSKKRRHQKDFYLSTLKKQKKECSNNGIRSAFAKRNHSSLGSTSTEQLSDQKLDSTASELNNQLQPLITPDENKIDSQQSNQILENESEQSKYDDLILKKKEMQNESNYTKNILKGFRRFFIKNFYSNKKLMNNFEKYYSINSLNNEFILKLLTVSPYTSYFKDFLIEDPEWWMNEAKITNKERQREIFEFYQKQDISLIKTKRKNFNQKIICKLEKSGQKDKSENTQPEDNNNDLQDSNKEGEITPEESIQNHYTIQHEEKEEKERQLCNEICNIQPTEQQNNN